MDENSTQDRASTKSTVDEIPIRAVVEEYPDRPSECTLFPVAVVDRDQRLAMWITAVGDAFVSLTDSR